MIKTALFIGIVVTFPLESQDKAAAYRAQGRYYSAKEAFEAKRFDDAARMLRESRTMLGGKSNIRLQYLLVRSLYNAGRFRDSQTEMNVYLSLIERTNGTQYANFPQDVDRLTSDETREITMLIDKIDAEVANDTEGKRAAAAKAANDAAALAARRNADAAALASRQSAALSNLRSCVLTGYVGKETPFTWNQTAYIVTVSLQGSFAGVGVTIEGKSEGANDRGTAWIPRHRNRSTATVNMGDVRSFRFSHVVPSQRSGRARNGQSIPFREGGYVDQVLRGKADAATVLLELFFRSEFSQLLDYKYHLGSGGFMELETGSESNTLNRLVLPVRDSACARPVAAELVSLARQ